MAITGRSFPVQRHQSAVPVPAGQPPAPPFDPSTGFDWESPDLSGQDLQPTQGIFWFAEEAAQGLEQGFLRASTLNVNGSNLYYYHLTWGALTGAVSWNIYRSLDLGVTWSLYANTTGLSYDDHNVTTSATYYYRVAGVSAFGEGALSAAAATSLNPSRVDFSWDGLLDRDTTQAWPTVDTGAEYVQLVAPVTFAYLVDWDGQLDRDISGWFAQWPTWATGGEEPVAPPTAPPFNPANGYDWTDGSGQQDQQTAGLYWFAPDAAQGQEQGFLNAPANPTATAEVWWIQFSWSAVAGATSYIVYRSVDGGAYSIVSPSQATSPYTDHNSNTLRSYQYTVASVNAFGVGAITTPTAGTTPLVGGGMFDWDGTQDVDTSQRWYAETEQAWGFPDAYFPANVPADLGALFGYEANQDLDQTQRWFAEEAAFDFPLPYATQATTAQESLFGWDAGQDVSTVQQWFAPDDAYENPRPTPVAPLATVLSGLWYENPQEQVSTVQQWFAPDASVEGSRPLPNAPTLPDFGWDGIQDVDLSVRWFAPEEAVTGAPPLPNAPTHPDYGWDAGQDIDTSQRWYQEPDDTWGYPPFATVPGGLPGVYQQPDWSESAGNYPTWYQPEDAYEDPLPIADEPVPVPGGLGGIFGWDATADVDRTQQWFAPDAAAEPGYPNLTQATTAQEPVQVDDLSEQTPTQGLQWYQEPDDTLGIPPFQHSTATAAQDAGLWPENPQEQVPTQAIWWYQEPDDTLGIPPFQHSTATVPQEPLYDWDAQQDVDLTQRWFQDEHCQFITVLSYVTVASVPQQAALWPEQPVAWQDGTPWFAPEASVEGFRPLPPAPTLPDYGWDGATDRWQDGSPWYQPEDDTLATTRPNAPTAPDYGWDGLQDVDLSVRWYQPEDDTFAYPRPDAPTAPDFGWDAQQDRDLTQTWVTWEVSGEDPPREPLPNAPTAPDFGWDGALDRDISITWPTVETGGEFVGPAYPSTAAVPQQPIQQPDPSEETDRTILWYAPQPEIPGPFPLPPAPIHADFGWDALQDVDTTQTWFAPDAEILGIIPTVHAPIHADFGWDAAQDIDITQTWFAPEPEYWPASVYTIDPRPVVGTFYQGEPYEQRDLTQTWYQPEDEWYPTFPRGPVYDPALTPSQEPDWTESADQTVVWFAPDAEILGQPARVNAPTHPDYGWAAEQDVDRTATWFAPDAAIEDPLPPNSYPAHTPQFPIQQPEPTEEADRTIVWFAPEPCEWTPVPNLTVPTVAQMLGALQASEAVEQVDRTQFWFTEPEDTLASFVGAVQVKRGKVKSTDHATNDIAVTDRAANNVAASDSLPYQAYVIDSPSGVVNSTDTAANVVVSTDY